MHAAQKPSASPTHKMFGPARIFHEYRLPWPELSVDTVIYVIFDRFRVMQFAATGPSLPVPAQRARFCSKRSPCYVVSHDPARSTQHRNRVLRPRMKCSG